jgi:hypothetical protein
LQEKVVEKVGNLPELAEDVLAVLVVDCTDINFAYSIRKIVVCSYW